MSMVTASGSFLKWLNVQRGRERAEFEGLYIIKYSPSLEGDKGHLYTLCSTKEISSEDKTHTPLIPHVCTAPRNSILASRDDRRMEITVYV